MLTSAISDSYGATVGTVSGDPYSGYNGENGYYNDPETGLQLLGHRFYDQATGRFINCDPIGYDGGINIYGYCGNGPVGGADPSGLYYEMLPAFQPGVGPGQWGPEYPTASPWPGVEDGGTWGGGGWDGDFGGDPGMAPTGGGDADGGSGGDSGGGGGDGVPPSDGPSDGTPFPDNPDEMDGIMKCKAQSKGGPSHGRNWPFQHGGNNYRYRYENHEPNPNANNGNFRERHDEPHYHFDRNDGGNWVQGGNKHAYLPGETMPITPD